MFVGYDFIPEYYAAINLSLRHGVSILHPAGANLPVPVVVVNDPESLRTTGITAFVFSFRYNHSLDKKL